MSIFVLHTRVFFNIYPQGDRQLKYIFNFSCLRVKMSYHISNYFSKLLDKDLIVKIGFGILSFGLMDRECNCSLPSKVNGKCI